MWNPYFTISYLTFLTYFLGKLYIGEYDQSKWGPPCQSCLFSFCKKTTMKLFAEGKNYSEIKYIGDGSNDLHAALALTEKDILFPRKNHKLMNIISRGGCNIKAAICPWDNGLDIMNFMIENKK